MTNTMTTLIDQHVRYDLAESTSPALTVGEIADLAEFADTVLGYGTSRGAVDLRELIAKDTGVTPDQVLVTGGAIEAMSAIAQVTCRPGDQRSPCHTVLPARQGRPRAARRAPRPGPRVVR
ncbi:aminotransferase class I/II-fold pyridoxal phosphate-dependent enzyme [Actinokineospora sp. HUAS TT18]|uniref:aminotransferase class I/II-fold pyridoxal phosphate-dependent enzyme n=1 Tax=Actinokineospora sp. HUAS TT18 TaxID=3447451 RepID=UPI003F520D28